MIAIALVWYLLGLIVFYSLGQLSVDYWAEAYYIWDKAKDVFFIAAIHQIVRARAVYWILLFSIIRLIWEIFSSITGVLINNEKAVAVLFLILAIICLVILLSESTRWRKQNLR